MKLEAVTKLDRRNKKTERSQKTDDDVMSKYCDVMVIFFELWPI